MAILSKLWTSSHGRKNLPEAIFSAFEKQKRFEIPEIIYKPGLKLTKDVVSKMVLAHCSSGFKHSLNEIMSDQTVMTTINK